MTILTALLFAATAVSAALVNNNTATMNAIPMEKESAIDADPNAMTIKKATMASQQPNNPVAIWDIQHQFDVYAQVGALSNVGAEWDGTYLYSCKWNGGEIYQFQSDGTYVKTFYASPASNLRDLAWDGTYLYGGAASGTIWGIDPSTETVEDTITGSFQSRALAYNEDTDQFYCSNWGDPVWIVNRDGSIAGQFNLGTTTSTYGFAYDNVCDGGGPYLWVFDQTGSPSSAMIYQWDLTAGAFTGVTHDAAGDVGYGSAGGNFFADDYEPGYATLGCLVQGGYTTTPDMMVMYEICDTVAPDHDVGVKVINEPSSGDAAAALPVEVTVKNFGNNTETFNVTVDIDKVGFGVEYTQTEQVVNLAPGAEDTVVFTDWNPADWLVASNVDIDYEVTACTDLADDNPANDCKLKAITLHYGFIYDVAVISIDSPPIGRGVPAQTFNVEATVENVGQAQITTCAKFEISEVDYSSPVLLYEDYQQGSYYNPPPGWTKGGDPGWSNYAWYWYPWSNYLSSVPGTAAPNARLRWYYAQHNNWIMSPEINTAGNGAMDLELAMYIDNYAGGYDCQINIRSDPSAAWQDIATWNPVSGNVGPDLFTLDASSGIGAQTQIQCKFDGYYYYLDYWYLDNFKLFGYAVLPAEYVNVGCTVTLDPGDVVQIPFAQWTPDFLQYGLNGVKNYLMEAYIDYSFPQDENPANDLLGAPIELDFFHDTAIEIASPAALAPLDLVWDQYDTDGSNGLSLLGTPRRSILDDFVLTETAAISEFRSYNLWNTLPPGSGTDYEVTFWTDNGGQPGTEIETSVTVSYSETATGRVWFNRQETEIVYTFDPITLSAGTYWCEGWTTAAAPENNFWMARLSLWGSECWVDYEDFGGLQPGSNVFGTEYDVAFQLYGSTGGPPGVDLYVAPGVLDIDGLVENLGTFEETGLTAYAEIWEYVSDPNGTLDYTDSISGIDLDPLGGSQYLAFADYDFDLEGVYKLSLDFPTADDVDTSNNEDDLGIGVDVTPPQSSHTLDPATPSGDNGWYTTDVEVTLEADDETGTINSGVAEIKYSVNGGTPQTYTGPFMLTDDGDDVLVEYWAIDNVGHEETPNSFTVDIDQTPPSIDLTWEAFQESGVWFVTFTATCDDALSGNWKVRFDMNGVEQITIEDPGPTYQWTMDWTNANFIIRATIWDMAGNDAFDEVDSDDIEESSYSMNTQSAVKILRTTMMG
jgi:hypothetical protein